MKKTKSRIFSHLDLFTQHFFLDKYVRFSFRHQLTAHKNLRITVQYIKLVQQTLYTEEAVQDGTVKKKELISGMFKCYETNRMVAVTIKHTACRYRL